MEWKPSKPKQNLATRLLENLRAVVTAVARLVFWIVTPSLIAIGLANLAWPGAARRIAVFLFGG
jgi:hypothetical protein